MNSTARRTQARSTPRAHVPRRRQRSRSPDSAITRSSTLSTEPGGGQSVSSVPLQNTLSKRSKRRENQNPANSSGHNLTRGHLNDEDDGPVARCDKSKAKSLSSRNRHTVNQNTDTQPSSRGAVLGRRDRDRSLTRGESSKPSKGTSSVEPIGASDDHQLTGPLALAQYARLQDEAEKLRDVRSQHIRIMIATIHFVFTRSHSNYNGRKRQSRNRARLSMS